MWKIKLGGALQADIAAVFPGNWNHIILRTYHEINYKAYSRAKQDESWYYEDDEGENCNGLNYYWNVLLGYQMPLFINFIVFVQLLVIDFNGFHYEKRIE